MRLKTLLWVAVLVVCSQVAGGDSGQQSAGSAMSLALSLTSIDRASVELDIYSGLLNPQWPLALNDLQTLAQMLKTLQPTQAVKLFDGLGLRGFRVIMMADRSRNIDLQVQGKYVEWRENGKILYFVDKDCQLEQWLLTTGEKDLDHDVYQLLEDGFKQSDYCGGRL